MSNKKSAKNEPKAENQTPAPANEIDPALRIAVAKIVQELMDSGEFEIEIESTKIESKFTKKIAALEDRIAELEGKGTGKGAKRVNPADIAKA